MPKKSQINEYSDVKTMSLKGTFSKCSFFATFPYVLSNIDT